ncbi:WD40/YVTN/BNR-like repeat-containing protein [Maribellus maritimus]|uniref:WD40/YVTN/BNR-like repeat-containing protein n=1 Tax=Maribellus maritimus TaxID=2870838 RepID=UPI001EEB3538|nr:hypothetical protein [Maribellus maritimus]MCG6186954.1 hypothetical protein [Maribellus maritimus]
MKNMVLVCAFILTMNLLFPLSTEGQQFWDTTNEFWGGPKTGITITHDSVIIVSTNSAVMKSTNECEQLEKVLSASEIYSVFSTKEGKIFAGGLGKIFFSSDFGINWDSVSIHSNYPVIEFAENSTADIFAITSDYDEGDGVYYSGDHGVNWEKRNSGLGTHLGCSNIAVDKNDLLYLTISDEQNVGFGGLFVSDDDGLTWEKISVSVNLLSNPIRIGTTTGLSVLPNDSIYLSFYGLASNYLI